MLAELTPAATADSIPAGLNTWLASALFVVGVFLLCIKAWKELRPPEPQPANILSAIGTKPWPSASPSTTPASKTSAS